MEWQINNVSIDKIYRSEQSKDGKPFVSSKGNPYVKVDIYIDPRAIEDGDFTGKMSYFDYYGTTNSWEQGTTVSGTVVRNEVNGRTYFNFSLPPSGKKALELDIKELENRITKLENKVFGMGHTAEVKDALDFSKEALREEVIEDNTEDDLPF
jgi:hypothetical protein